MSTTISTTTQNTLDPFQEAQKSPIFPIIKSYLDTVITKKGNAPTDEQKKNFILECVANKLNPIKKQAYLIGYDSYSGPSFATIVSISGQTSIAARTGLYAGVDQPQFFYNNNQLISCSVTVYKIVQGIRCGFTGNAYMKERIQTKDVWIDGRNTGNKVPTEQWVKQPKTMIEKCARAAALRNAFPEELGNFYDETEMPPTDVQVKEIKTLTARQSVAKLVEKLENKQGFYNKLAEKYSVESIEDLTDQQIDELLAKFREKATK